MSRSGRARMGRPPRTDDPKRLAIMLPGAQARWLQRRALAEGRPQGDVVADALARYQRQVSRRGRTA